MAEDFNRKWVKYRLSDFSISKNGKPYLYATYNDRGIRGLEPRKKPVFFIHKIVDGDYVVVPKDVVRDVEGDTTWRVKFPSAVEQVANEAYAVIKTAAPFGAKSFTVVGDKATAARVARIKNKTVEDDDKHTYIYRKMDEVNSEKYNIPVNEGVENMKGLVDKLLALGQETAHANETYGDYAAARPNSNRLLGQLDDYLDGKTLAEELINWMPDDEVGRFAEEYGYFPDEADFEELEAEEGLTEKDSTDVELNGIKVSNNILDMYKDGRYDTVHHIILDLDNKKFLGYVGTREDSLKAVEGTNLKVVQAQWDGGDGSWDGIVNGPDLGYDEPRWAYQKWKKDIDSNYDEINDLVYEWLDYEDEEVVDGEFGAGEGLTEKDKEVLDELPPEQPVEDSQSLAEERGKHVKSATERKSSCEEYDETERELFEAMNRNSITDFQASVSDSISRIGSLGTIQLLLDSGLADSFEDELFFIKNTYDLSDTQLVSQAILDAGETLLEDGELERAMETLKNSSEEENEEEFGEYVEPEDWSEVDQVEEGEVEEPVEEGEEITEEETELGEENI